MLIGINRHLPIAKFGGWRKLAPEVQQAAGDLPILAERYHDASWLSFYLPNHPDVALLRKNGGRATQFDLMPCTVPPGARVLVVSDEDLAELTFTLNGRAGWPADSKLPPPAGPG